MVYSQKQLSEIACSIDAENRVPVIEPERGFWRANSPRYGRVRAWTRAHNTHEGHRCAPLRETAGYDAKL